MKKTIQLLLLLVVAGPRLGMAQTPHWYWAKQAGGTTQEQGLAIAVDGSGNCYVTGGFQNTMAFGSKLSLMTNAVQAIPNELSFASTVGLSIGLMASVASSSPGGVTIVGLTATTVTLSGTASNFPLPVGTLVTFAESVLLSNGSFDVYLAKYDSSGNLLWTRGGGGTGSDLGFSVALDNSQHIYVTGSFSNTATFSSQNVTSLGLSDIFISKYDAQGNITWVKSAGGVGNDFGYGICQTPQGYLYLTGIFSGSAGFGSSILNSSGGRDVFITQIDTSGHVVWAKNAGGIQDDYGNSVSTDAFGNAYITGYFSGAASFGSNILNSTGGTNDIFTAKYDAAGTAAWAKKAGGSGVDLGHSIATNQAGTSFITGNFSGMAVFGNDTLVSFGNDDIFVASYDSSGQLNWVRQAGGIAIDHGNGNFTDNAGLCYVCGSFQDTAYFGNLNLVSSGFNDVFAAAYDSTGHVVWVQRAGGTSAESANGIATHGSNNCYLTGSFLGTSEFGNATLVSSGSDDFFVARLTNSILTAVPSFLAADHAWLIYPNPAEVSFSIDLEESPCQITILDQNGKKISELIISDQKQFDVSNLPAGIYFVELLSPYGSSYRKLVKL